MPSAWDLIDPRSPLSGVARQADLRRLQVHATCPTCHLRWQASAPTETATERDFQGVIYCPDCYDGSRSNPHLHAPFFQAADRLRVKERER